MYLLSNPLKSAVLRTLAAACFLASSVSFAAMADETPVKWTVVDGNNTTTVTTMQDTGAIQAEAPQAESVSAAPDSDSKDAEIEKAVAGIQEQPAAPVTHDVHVATPTDITREKIDLMFAPYRTQSKEEFLAVQEHDLNGIIDRAKKVHTQAKAAHEGISLAQRRMLLALRQMFPEFTFEYQHRDGSLSAAEYISRSEKATIRQPLFRGGILWNSFLQERQMLTAARSNYQKVIDDLVFEVSKVYFEYQRARNVMDDQEKALAAVKPQLEIAGKKFEEKLTSEIENLNVQSLAGQIEFDLETAKQELEIAKLDLQHRLGLAMSDTLNLKPEYEVEKVISSLSEEDMTTAQVESALGAFNKGQPIPSLDRLVEMSYGHRSELAVQVAQLQAARYGERVRWGGFVPKADLLVEFGALAESFKEFSNSPDHKGEFRAMIEVDWNAAGNKIGYTFEDDQRAPSVTQFQSGAGTLNKRNSFTVGFLNGLDAFVDVKQAEVEKLNKVVELEQAEKRVLEEVKRAYYDYQKALIQMKSAIKRVQWRLRLRDLAEHRLGLKEVEVSEYLQAEIDLLKERGEFHTALKDYYTAKSSLNYAVGVQEFLGIKQNG